MAENNKKARFFCEYCDHEVDSDAKFCPYCGRFFASVRCPKCGFTGNHATFSNGCPNCGYAMDGSSENDKQRKKDTKNKKLTKKERIYNSTHTEKYEDSLPFWIYFISIVLLIVLLLIIFQYM